MSKFRISQAEQRVLLAELKKSLPAHLRFVTQMPWHWQACRGNHVVCDVWPTVLKLRPPGGPTQQFGTPRNLVRAWSKIVNKTKPRHSRKSDKQLPLLEGSVKDEFKTDEQWAPVGRRFVCADLALDDEELRIIINAPDHTQSVRLSKATTREFLAAAAALAAELQTKTADKGERTDDS